MINVRKIDNTISINIYYNYKKYPMLLYNMGNVISGIEHDVSKIFHGNNTASKSASNTSNSSNTLNDYNYNCSSGGSFAIYNDSTLTERQKEVINKKYPGKPKSYYACIQGCSGSCNKGSYNGLFTALNNEDISRIPIGTDETHKYIINLHEEMKESSVGTTSKIKNLASKMTTNPQQIEEYTKGMISNLKNVYASPQTTTGYFVNMFSKIGTEKKLIAQEAQNTAQPYSYSNFECQKREDPSKNPTSGKMYKSLSDCNNDTKQTCPQKTKYANDYSNYGYKYEYDNSFGQFLTKNQPTGTFDLLKSQQQKKKVCDYSSTGPICKDRYSNFGSCNVCASEGNKSGVLKCSELDKRYKYIGYSDKGNALDSLGKMQPMGYFKTDGGSVKTPLECYNQGLKQKSGDGVMVMMKDSKQTYGGLQKVNCKIVNIEDVPGKGSNDKMTINYATGKFVTIGKTDYAGYFLGNEKKVKTKLKNTMDGVNANANKGFDTWVGTEPIWVTASIIASIFDPKIEVKLKKSITLADKLKQDVGLNAINNFTTELTKYFVTLKAELKGQKSSGLLGTVMSAINPNSVVKIGDALNSGIWYDLDKQLAANKALEVKQYIKTLANLFDEISKNSQDEYLKMKEMLLKNDPNFMNRLKTQVSSGASLKIKSNLNNLISSLGQEFNVQTETYNVGVNALKNYGLYDENKKNELEKQLNKLDTISDKISTRDRLIQINQEQASVNDKRIAILRKIYIPLIICVIVYTMMTMNGMSNASGFSAMFVVLIAYIIYVVVKFKSFNMSQESSMEVDKIKGLFSDAEQALNNEAIKVQTKIAEYTDKNCDCPKKKKKKKEKVRVGDSDDGVVYVDDGKFYYDGTSPVEKIAESGDLEPVKPYTIDWETDKMFGNSANNKLNHPNPPYSA